MLAIPDEILKALEQDKLVLFVGSGFSKSLGLRDWRQLANQAIQEYSKTDANIWQLQGCLEKGLLSEILIFDALRDMDKNKILEIIKSETNQSFDSNKLESHKKLWEISQRIITTNYDKAIDTVKPQISIEVISHNHVFELGKSLRKDSWLFHIHGMIDNVRDCIIFSEGYYQLYQKAHPAIEQLKFIAINNTILFLGFSMKDKYVAKLFEDLNVVFGDTPSSSHFILLEKDETLHNRHLTKIPVESYAQIPEILDQLIKAKTSHLRGPVPVIRYLRRRCRSFKPGSTGFNQIIIELRSETFMKSNIDNFKNKISHLTGYEKAIAQAALYENSGEIEKMKQALEGVSFNGEEETTRLLYLAIAYEKLDWLPKAIQILDKIIANPTIDSEMAICAKFNRSVCSEKIGKYDEVFFEKFIYDATTLKFTNERVRDKAISNHLIICKKLNQEFKYEDEFKESTEYEFQILGKSQAKTLINYLTYKNASISRDKYDEILKLSEEMTVSARVASVCNIFKLLDKESINLLKDEVLAQIQQFYNENKSEAIEKHLESLRIFIKQHNSSLN